MRQSCFHFLFWLVFMISQWVPLSIHRRCHQNHWKSLSVCWVSSPLMHKAWLLCFILAQLKTYKAWGFFMPKPFLWALTRGELKVLHTRRSRGWLWGSRGQHLRHGSSGVRCHHRGSWSADGAGGLRCWLDDGGGWLCLDRVRTCADRHGADGLLLAAVHQRTRGAGARCSHHRGARGVVPVQSRARPGCCCCCYLQRRPDKRHGGSRWRPAHRLTRGGTLRVRERRLDHGVRGGGQRLEQHRAAADSRGRYDGAVPDHHGRPLRGGSASCTVRVHSWAPIKSLRWGAYFPRVVREKSYTVTDKRFGRVASGYGVGAGVRCVHSWTMGGSKLSRDPPALQLVSQSSLNDGARIWHIYWPPCQLRRLFVVCTRRDTTENMRSSQRTCF